MSDKIFYRCRHLSHISGGRTTYEGAMSNAAETDAQQRLSKVAIDLRVAASVAVTRGSWFAPTLDDCRVDVERLLAIGRHDDDRESHALIFRAELALRTWRRIVAVDSAGRARPHCDCGGRLVETARPGRIAPFRGRPLEIPSSFAIPTCEQCGAECLDEETGARLDAILLAQYFALGR
ncbi:MAG: hypothetical protein JWM53_56 [bacterium]|nr:hypothetical protein [bacterium]